MNTTKRRIVFIVLCIIAISGIRVFSEEAVKNIADMENGLKYTFNGIKSKPKISISSETASQGNKSLCFEYTGKGKDRAWVTIPVKADLSPYNVLAFDFYCKNNNGAKFFVILQQKIDSSGKKAFYGGKIKLKAGRDGWTTVRLIKDRTLCLGKNVKAKGDWSKIKEMTFGIRSSMHGKALFFIDNIRFENKDNSANILYNGNFEITTNSDVPDGWRRDFRVAPFSNKAWGIDNKEAFAGTKSLRIACKNKYVSSLAGSSLTRLRKNKLYTFSVYLKSNKSNTKARIYVSQIRPSGKTVSVGTTWKRYDITGKAVSSSTGSVAKITFLSEDSILWVDAAQLEEGNKATRFSESSYEATLSNTLTTGKKKRKLRENKGNPCITLKKVDKEPAINGKIWNTLPSMTPFIKLDKAGNSEKITISKICYDDKAIYILVQAREKNMKKVKDLYRKNKKGPFGTDLIEVFIRPNHNSPGYYHFAANARGDKYFSRYSAPKAKKDWECDWKVSGEINNKAWKVEFKIPFTCFDPSENIDNRIGINICRTSPPNKYSTWSPCFSSGFVFHTPSSFGIAKGFDKKVFTPYRLQINNLDFHRGKASAIITNNTGKDSSINIKFTAIDSKGKKISSSNIRKVLRAGKSSELSSILNFKNNGIYKLKVEANNDSKSPILISQPISFRLSKNSIFTLSGTEYNFYTIDKKAKVRAFLEIGKKRSDRMQIKYSVLKNGKLIYGPKKFKPKSGINEWEFPVKQFANGNYLISAKLLDNGKVVAKQKSSFVKCNPLKNEVRINQWGKFFVFNKTPIFPYGFFDNSIGRNDLKNWENIMKNLKEANCNVSIQYTWQSPDLEYNLKPFLDIADKYGQKIWVHLSPMTTYFLPKYASVKKRFTNEKDAAASLKRTIEKYKDHPALIGWCTVDEPGNRPHIFTKELMEKYYNTVKSLDPCHPCAPSHVNHIGDSKVYGKALDFSLLPYHTDSKNYEKLLQELLNLPFPVMINPPCFGALAEQKREPTPRELRVAIYKAIILGARGVCSYIYRCSSDILWNEFVKIGKELKHIGPILLTPNDKLRIETAPRNKGIYGLLKEYKGKYFLFTVNTSNKDIKAVFRLTDAKSFSKITPLFDSVKAEINPEEKKISVQMGKMTTAFYEIE